MEPCLKGVSILILGGDKRELELYTYLKKLGATVFLAGFDLFQDTRDYISSVDISKCLQDSQVVITPLTGIENNGIIYSPHSRQEVNILETAYLESLKPESIFIAGYLDDKIKKQLQKRGISTCETREMDEISILNAVPTAEGAIQCAMEHAEITIHNSESFVLGYGRCGKVLASTLQSLGARVTVFARSREVLSWVEIYKMKPMLLNHLPEAIHKADYIFNTIPSLVLTADILYQVKKECLILEVASFPGGIELEAARRLNIRIYSLPGLPGKVAPKTAGLILCKVYPSLILSLLKGGTGSETG